MPVILHWCSAQSVICTDWWSAQSGACLENTSSSAPWLPCFATECRTALCKGNSNDVWLHFQFNQLCLFTPFSVVSSNMWVCTCLSGWVSSCNQLWFYVPIKRVLCSRYPSRCLLYYARETTKESVRFKWPLRKDRVINKDKLDITKTNRHKKEKRKRCY